MTAIWGSGGARIWRALEPAAHQAEAELHDLVGRAPQMLPLAGSPRLTMLGREVRLGNGSADLLAVESTGRLVLIEVTLAGNAESRRAVVGQVLSYAGYLQGLDPEQLESQVLSGPVLAAVQSADQQHTVDAEGFRDGLARSLAEGSFRLVIVLDPAPDELVQVVG
jgi:RecB family endonuclease NucS